MGSNPTSSEMERSGIEEESKPIVWLASGIRSERHAGREPAHGTSRHVGSPKGNPRLQIFGRLGKPALRLALPYFVFLSNFYMKSFDSNKTLVNVKKR